MCGLIACLGQHDISKAFEKLEHRGVRGYLLRDQNFSIGHHRLPIVGLGKQYDQPYQSDEWAIAYVGEVLDFRDEDRTVESDVSYVMENWPSRGPALFIGRDGFWSLAAINKSRQELHYCVDYLAQKPLYLRPDKLAVASEPDALLEMGNVTPDELYYSSVIKWGYCPDQRRTPYNEIKRTFPGEYGIFKMDGSHHTSLTDPLYPSSQINLKREIVEAVRRRVIASDVPIAALVSGGLDSSIVYKIAERFGTVKPYVASDMIAPEEAASLKTLCEGKKMYSVNTSEVTAHKAIMYMQEPLDLGSVFPQVALSDAISGHANVCLTGDGADELFGGYGRAMRYDSQWSDVFYELVCYHLPRLDRVMMRNRIEVRSPFLARRVVEAALALPYEQRKNKNILRGMFREFLPPGVADIKKFPLRTSRILKDRESATIELVKIHRAAIWD